MADQSLLFKSAMVRAMLGGFKTETRRLLTPHNVRLWDGGRMTLFKPTQIQLEDALYKAADFHCDSPHAWAWTAHKMGTTERESRHGTLIWNAGEHIWVRETWMPRALGLPISRVMQPNYRADKDRPEWQGLWKSSLHMPRWASRLTLAVREVRIERLQDITDLGAKDEGATMRPACNGFRDQDAGWSMDWSPVGTDSRQVKKVLTESDISLASPRLAYAAYINEINGPDTWRRNPWVAVLTYRVLQENIDHCARAA